MTNPNPAAPLPDDWIDKRLSDPLWNEAWHFGYEAAKRDAARAPEGMDEIVAAIRSVLSVTPDTAEGAGMHRMGEYVIDKIATLDAARATSTPAGLRELSNAATPGPWETGDGDADRDAIRSVVATGYDREEGEQTYLVAWCHGDYRAEEDAAFIVAAVNYVRAALQGADR